MLPNFLIVGAMKAGTTSLYHYLREHPQVFMPSEKELKFFTDTAPDDNYRRGVPWYEQQFKGSEEHQARGEASPRYSKDPEFPGVPQRIRALLPDVRLVYCLRHPIERMRSHYVHELLRGDEKRPIDEALLASPHYLDASRYGHQLDLYLGEFDRRRICVITAEDLRNNRIATVRRVLGFLEVDATWSSNVIAKEFYETRARAEPRFVTTSRRTRLAPARTVLRAAQRTYVRFAPPRLLAVTHRAPQEHRPSPQVVEKLEGALREDIALLRSHLGASFHGWGIA